jgi:hypothetical protein
VDDLVSPILFVVLGWLIVACDFALYYVVQVRQPRD